MKKTIKIPAGGSEHVTVNASDFFRILQSNVKQLYTFVDNVEYFTPPGFAMSLDEPFKRLNFENRSDTEALVEVVIVKGGQVWYDATTLDGEVKSVDATTHGKLDTLATASQKTATAVQGLNAKFDGQYMAGVTPVGSNVFITSDYYKSVYDVVSHQQNPRGILLRTLSLFASQGAYHSGVMVAHQKLWVADDSTLFLEKNILLPPNSRLQVYGKVSISYDIL